MWTGEHYLCVGIHLCVCVCVCARTKISVCITCWLLMVRGWAGSGYRVTGSVWTSGLQLLFGHVPDSNPSQPGLSKEG